MSWKIGPGPYPSSRWVCTWSDMDGEFMGLYMSNSLAGWCREKAVVYDDGFSADRGDHLDGCCRGHLDKLPPQALLEFVWSANWHILG